MSGILGGAPRPWGTGIATGERVGGRDGCDRRIFQGTGAPEAKEEQTLSGGRRKGSAGRVVRRNHRKRDETKRVKEAAGVVDAGRADTRVGREHGGGGRHAKDREERRTRGSGNFP